MNPRSSVASPAARGHAGRRAPVTTRQASKPRAVPSRSESGSARSVRPGGRRPSRCRGAAAGVRCGAAVAVAPVERQRLRADQREAHRRAASTNARWRIANASSTPAAPAPRMARSKRGRLLRMRSTIAGHAATKPSIGRIGSACSTLPGRFAMAATGPVSIESRSKGQFDAVVTANRSPGRIDGDRGARRNVTPARAASASSAMRSVERVVAGDPAGQHAGVDLPPVGRDEPDLPPGHGRSRQAGQNGELGVATAEQHQTPHGAALRQQRFQPFELCGEVHVPQVSNSRTRRPAARARARVSAITRSRAPGHVGEQRRLRRGAGRPAHSRRPRPEGKRRRRRAISACAAARRCSGRSTGQSVPMTSTRALPAVRRVEGGVHALAEVAVGLRAQLARRCAAAARGRSGAGGRARTRRVDRAEPRVERARHASARQAALQPRGARRRRAPGSAASWPGPATGAFAMIAICTGCSTSGGGAR